MLCALKSIRTGFFAIAAAALTSHLQPALAQSDDLDIPASWVVQYSEYYAPYAIQAAAAYQPVSALDKTREPTAKVGDDVKYVVDNTFTDNAFGPDAAQIRSRAQDALKEWHYQFGSDSYLSCIDKTDSECRKALPKWYVYHRQRGGPAFQVWAHKNSFPLNIIDSESCAEVSIAFRGTVASHKSDWASNAHVLTKYVFDDHYRQLYRNIDGIIRKVTELNCYKRANAPHIVSVGHSLGGGLAQLAALANKRSPRIHKVFAFDPSPVTGADLVDPQTLKENSEGLTIDRIFQFGEVLEKPRDWVQGYPPSKNPCNPRVRIVAVDALRGDSIKRHGVGALAAQLIQLSHQGGVTNLRPGSNGCKTRYDEDLIAGGRVGMPVAAASGGQQGFYALWSESPEAPRMKATKLNISVKSRLKPAAGADPVDSLGNLLFGWISDSEPRPQLRKKEPGAAPLF
jgi:pimeloyl-ACP methyl ester carboxylesterase